MSMIAGLQHFGTIIGTEVPALHDTLTPPLEHLSVPGNVCPLTRYATPLRTHAHAWLRWAVASYVGSCATPRPAVQHSDPPFNPPKTRLSDRPRKQPCCHHLCNPSAHPARCRAAPALPAEDKLPHGAPRHAMPPVVTPSPARPSVQRRLRLPNKDALAAGVQRLVHLQQSMAPHTEPEQQC